MPHEELHTTQRIGWLRAAVLGANDGIVSTSSLLIGVAAAQASHGEILTAGVAGLVAGGMSMAAGEYVSVSSQADAQRAELALEAHSLEHNVEYEKRELERIYADRGLDEALAIQVAEQLMAHDPLGAHARDELGMSHRTRARPVQAAVASACTFAVGAALPLLVAFLASMEAMIPWLGTASLGFLGVLGALAARAGGASPLRGAARVTLWGALAMTATAAVGSLFGTAF